MERLHEFIGVYLLVLGILFVLIGIAELVYPVKAYNLWSSWTKKRFFFLHGILLIAGGLPLTVYTGTFSGIVFVLGLLAVLTGPVILLYPEKIRDTFKDMAHEWGSDKAARIIIAEAVLRICAGALFVACFLL